MTGTAVTALAAGAAMMLGGAMARAQCEQPWFEPRVLERAEPLAAIDWNGSGLLELVATDSGGLWLYTLDSGPAPVRTAIYPGSVGAGVAADFDGDGDTDLAVFTEASSVVRVFLHEGESWVESAAVAVAGTRLFALDHLGDGDTDLMVIDNDGVGRVLSNPGDGALVDAGPVTPAGIRYFRTGLVDADTRDDLLVSFGAPPGDAVLLLQQPDGSFLPGPDPAGWPGLLADVDGDGLDDMLTRTDAALEVRLAVGDGTFAAAAVLLDDPAHAEFVDDFDGDGDQDMLVNRDGDRLVYRNLGGQVFELAEQDWIPIYLPDPPFLADIDGDGARDLVTSLYRVGGTFLRGNGDCSFASPPTLQLEEDLEIHRMTVGDLDQDGDTDAVVLVSGGALDGGVVICRNNGLGGFDVVRSEMGAEDAEAFEAPILADLDGDGDTDIAFWVDGLIVLLENTPDGQFSVRREIAAGQAYPGAPLLSADIDGNGLPDLLYPPILVGEHTTLLRNQGGWAFEALPLDTDPYPVPRALVDVTGDGIEDLLATNRDIDDGELGVLPGAGDGSFGQPIASDLQWSLTEWFIPGDFDGDGDTDLLGVATIGIHLLAGDGTGEFVDLGEIATYADAHGLGVADLNGDGYDDLVTGGLGGGRVGMHLSNGDGTFTEPVVLAAHNARTVAPVELNGDAGIDLLIAHNRFPQSGGTLTTLLNQCGPFHCRVDLNRDGRVDTMDFIEFLGLWAAQQPRADWTDDGEIDTRDFVAFLNDWAAGCP